MQSKTVRDRIGVCNILSSDCSTSPQSSSQMTVGDAKYFKCLGLLDKVFWSRKAKLHEAKNAPHPAIFESEPSREDAGD